MGEAKRKPATYADLEAVPPELTAEIIFGVLETHPRPVPRHARAAARLTAIVGPPFDLGSGGPGGWIFMIEPELHLGPHVLAPDLAGWRRQRLLELPDTAYIETPPDWVCELLSPKTENRDRGDKQRIYASFDVGHLWPLNATARRLEVFELKSGKWQLFDTFVDADEVRAPPFDAIAFSLGLLWPFDTLPEQD